MRTFRTPIVHIPAATLLFTLTAFSLSELHAAPIVNMQLLNSIGEPNIYQFSVNGSTTPQLTLCDDAAHSIITTPYQATEYTLADLSGTLLGRTADPNALLDYEHIAMLDLIALANPNDPTVIGNAVEAIWSITQNRQERNLGAAALLNQVLSQDPSTVNLSGFVIFASNDVQEQTGFSNSPEPGTWLLVATSAGLFLLLRLKPVARLLRR